MRESNFAFPPQNRACVCITSQLYDRRALDATSALPLYNSLTHLVYLTSTSPRIREILTLDGGLERLVRILRDFCANPPRRRDAAWIYALSPPEDLPRTIEHRSSPITFEPADEPESSFFLESSSRAELEKAANQVTRFRIGIQHSQDTLQKPHPSAYSVPYIPTPGTPFPYAIDPLASRTFSLAFQSVVNIGVRGSEHIRRRVVQAGALGGPSATGSGAPRESREVRVRRREEALERQRAADLARALEAAGPRNPTPTSRATNPSSDEGDEEMSASDLGPSPTPPPVINRSMSNDSDTSFASGPTGSDLPLRTISPVPTAGPSTGPPSPALPRAISINRAISPTTAQSSDASANATPVGSGTPTGSVVVPGRDRSGTVVGRPVWDDAPRPGWDGQENMTTGRAGWDDGQRARWEDGPVPARPQRDTDGDDTEADPEENNVPGERRTVGIVDAADGDGAMAMEMMGEGVGVGVVTLEQNDDLAMGAPPGAPGAVMPVGVGLTTPRPRVPVVGNELTPRPGLAPLVTGETPPEPRRAVVPGINPGPYGDEEVLFSLQLLAYLSKYPHVRQAFYETPPTLRQLVDASAEPKTSVPSSTSGAQSPNVFSLVERFTFRPSPSETTLPRLPNEIQYWAGCANMLCGRWEDFPREFAKCRRCRKAKYCGKECQSKAWAEGHRFWCSAREEDDTATVVGRREMANAAAAGVNGAAAVATEVEVPTRRGLTTTVTRALVNIAGGMTGRNPTPPVQPPRGVPTPVPPRTGTAGPAFAGRAVVGPGTGTGAGAGGGRLARPMAVPAGTAGTRPPGTATGTPAATGTTPPGGMNWTPTPTPALQDNAGPSRRSRGPGPETARRRSGTMPSAGAAPNTNGASADGWRVVPVERVSPAPSAPHTTPLQTQRGLDEDEMMVE
ncbi:MYND Zn-finger protein [Ceratobasidium sp. AG-Ba]|nr:MYND Zn-finger protein [Ceratobasidium sp. AG-Ba]